MPDTFQEVAGNRDYEVVHIGDDILLLPAPLNGERLKRIEHIANRSINDHRTTLERLAP